LLAAGRLEIEKKGERRKETGGRETER